MDDTIKWSDTTNREKTRLILEHIMKWTYFQRWEDYAGEKHWRIASQQTAITYPVAFWNDQTNQWSVFHQEEQDARPFDPLHSLDAAWLVVERVTRPPQSREEAVQGANTQFMLWWIHVDLWACTREAAANEICLAALKACGVEVENG